MLGSLQHSASPMWLWWSKTLWSASCSLFPVLLQSTVPVSYATEGNLCSYLLHQFKERCSSPPITLVTLLWTCSSSRPSFFLWEPRSYETVVEGQNAPLSQLAPADFAAAQAQLPFWSVSAHGWVMLNFSSTNIPKSFSGCSQSIHPPAYICAWDCTHVQDPNLAQTSNYFALGDRSVFKMGCEQALIESNPVIFLLGHFSCGKTSF